jgi:hypothetical protein
MDKGIPIGAPLFLDRDSDPTHYITPSRSSPDFHRFLNSHLQFSLLLLCSIHFVWRSLLRPHSEAIFCEISRGDMAISLRNGLRLGGINEFARESCSVWPVSKAVGLTNEFNFGTKRNRTEKAVSIEGL